MAEEIVVKMRESGMAKSLHFSVESKHYEKKNKRNFMRIHSSRVEHER